MADTLEDQILRTLKGLRYGVLLMKRLTLVRQT